MGCCSDAVSSRVCCSLYVNATVHPTDLPACIRNCPVISIDRSLHYTFASNFNENDLLSSMIYDSANETLSDLLMGNKY